MNGFICGYGRNEDYSTNEAYRKYVKRKAAVAGCLMVLGLIAIAAELIAENILKIAIDDFMSGFFIGIGSGLFFSGMILMIKRLRLLSDEKKLKEMRIAESDERNRSISVEAQRIATAVLLVAMYIVMIAGLIFTKELIMLMSMLICLFLLVYVLAYKILQNKR